MRPPGGQRALRFSTSLPPISRRRILPLRAHTRLAGEERVGVRATDVSARTAGWISRTLRRRLAAWLIDVDAGLSSGGSTFLGSGAAPDALARSVVGTAGEPGRW